MITKRQDQQTIRSMIENWNWETINTPQWLKELLDIAIKIDNHNNIFKNDNLTPLSYPLLQKLIEIRDLLD